jgi:hypothetical protein
MMQSGKVARGFGAYCFAFGYLILGLAASGSDIATVDVKSRRYLLGIGSAIAVVAGTLMMYYHLQERVRHVLQNRMEGHPMVRQDILKSVPLLHHMLVYGGFVGLAMTIALREDDSLDMTKMALSVGALAVIGYTKDQMLKAAVSGVDLQKHQFAHVLSWGLLVLAIGYKC